MGSNPVGLIHGQSTKPFQIGPPSRPVPASGEYWISKPADHHRTRILTQSIRLFAGFLLPKRWSELIKRFNYLNISRHLQRLLMPNGNTSEDQEPRYTGQLKRQTCLIVIHAGPTRRRHRSLLPHSEYAGFTKALCTVPLLADWLPEPETLRMKWNGISLVEAPPSGRRAMGRWSLEQSFVSAPIGKAVDPLDLPGDSIGGEVESLFR